MAAWMCDKKKTMFHGPNNGNDKKDYKYPVSDLHNKSNQYIKSLMRLVLMNVITICYRFVCRKCIIF
jgi:hypothetical protein